jgi:two-component system response regulator
MELPTVLIVEDNHKDRSLFEHAMKKAKLANRFQFVENGVEAVRYFSGHGKYGDRTEYPLPALVLLDYHMPLMNGAEVLQWLRAHESFKKTLVVIMTATADDWEIRRASDAGADEYLRKPGDLAGMVRLIEGLPVRWALLPEASARGATS